MREIGRRWRADEADRLVQEFSPLTSGHGRARERLWAEELSAANGHRYEGCGRWRWRNHKWSGRRVARPKGGRGRVADVANGESREGVAIDGKWGCVTEIWLMRDHLAIRP